MERLLELVKNPIRLDNGQKGQLFLMKPRRRGRNQQQ
uniref:Uncharacterized protein n=1 Tax=Arundo donax TaxID=35708 RepID=A0A0A9BEI2_ARUDO